MGFCGFFAQAMAQERVEAFFNNLESESYTDPYRGITRPGQDLEKVIVEEILKAKESVNVAVQELRLPRIAKALVKMQNKGVRVRVVLENSYNNTLFNAAEPSGDDVNQHEASRFVDLFALVDMDGDGVVTTEEMDQRDAVHILNKGGVEIKDDTFDGSMGSALMHHKFVVIDNKTLIVSTANFTMSGTHGDILIPESRGNANSLIRIESERAARIFNQEFYLMWGGKSGRLPPRFGISKGFRGAKAFKVQGSPIHTQFSPTSKVIGWERSVNGLIGSSLESAKKEVLMALFVFSDQRLSNILMEKREKNEDLRIGLLIEPKFAYREYSEMLDMWGLSMLDPNCQMEEGNRPWRIPLRNIGIPSLSKGDMLHHKFAVIDKETVVVGSQNWSVNANLQNDENVIVIKNKSVAAAYVQEFERLERNAILGPTASLLSKIDVISQACSQL